MLVVIIGRGHPHKDHEPWLVPSESPFPAKQLEFTARKLRSVAAYPNRLLWSIPQQISCLGSDRFLLQMALGVSNIYTDYVKPWGCFIREGISSFLVTDNGSQFCATGLKCCLDRIGCRHLYTIPSHRCSNGAAKNFVRSVRNALLSANPERCRSWKHLQWTSF